MVVLVLDRPSFLKRPVVLVVGSRTNLVRRVEEGAEKSRSENL